MVTVYVLKSIKNGKFYTGMAKDAELRLKEHNAGKSKFTKGHLPWILIYTEQHQDWESARIREKYFKSAAGKRHLLFLLSKLN